MHAAFRFVAIGMLGITASTTVQAERALADEVGVRIRFGLNDKEGTNWDGSVAVSPGKVTHISGWRFTAGDKVIDTTGWKASTRQAAQVGRGNNPAKAKAKAKGALNNGPINDNGVQISLIDVTEASRISVKTPGGDFDFALSEIPYGKIVEKLKGGVEIERIGTAKQLTTSRTDDDYPSAAVGPDGTLYTAWVSFTPGNNRDDYNPLEDGKGTGGFAASARGWARSPTDFSFLAKRPGGDRVWLRSHKDGKWSDPIAVTSGGGDIYKCAVAVDKSGSAVVAWSENVNWTKSDLPNFEILSATVSGTKVSELLNVSNNGASDINPTMATDSNGNVWLAWQGVRNNVFGILERHQVDGKWNNETAVSNHTRSCWTPAIAASAKGQVAIAWDTYDKGDYDVWVREYSAKDGTGKGALAVANSIDYEARPSLTYDASGALWIAYELGSPTWGKNYGALVEDQGLPLYRGRQVGMIVLKDGQWHDPVASHIGVLPGAKPRRRLNNQRVPAIEPGGESPAQARAAEWLRDAAYNNLARIATDKSGHIWLLCRSRQNDFRFPVLGTLWLSWAAYYDGNSWVGPILLPNSDNLMYNTPAAAPAPDGGLYVVHSTDHRQERFPVRDSFTSEGPGEAWTVPGDPFDNDVYFSRLMAPGGNVSSLALKSAKYPPEASTSPSNDTVAERAAIARCREHSITVGGRKLMLIRGEFHRHTEISGDGGNDGPLEDMWRYALDVSDMDWLGNSDHDNGAGREYTWWLTQKTTDAFRIASRFEPPFTYERSVRYPEGHRNVMFAQRGVRTLPRLPITDRKDAIHAPDTQMLYRYLKHFGGICASHTSATGMGTDWRDNDPEVEPFVEIYQGDRQNYERPGAPRCPTEDYSIGGWEPKGFVNLALLKGYRLAFECSSDHISTHISYAHIYADNNSPAALVKAIKLRHTYGSTDNIIADYRCTADGAEHIMGEEFSSTKAPSFSLHLVGTGPFAKVTLVKDDVEVPLKIDEKAELKLTWTDPNPTPGKTSYYYVRGEQKDGELVWVSPMWVKYQPATASGAR